MSRWFPSGPQHDQAVHLEPELQPHYEETVSYNPYPQEHNHGIELDHLPELR